MPKCAVEIRMNLSHIASMSRISEKLLVIALMLLLGLSPLHGAMGEIDSFSQHGESVHQIFDLQDDDVVDHSNHSATQECGQCNIETGCNGHSCSTGHCVTCVIALLPVFSLPTNHLAESLSSRLNNRHLKPISSSLFRPPRT